MDAALALAAQLETARARAGRSRRDLAYTAGLSPATINRALNTGKATLHTVVAIARVLGLQLYAVPPPPSALHQPCGTTAAARRHYVHHEPLDALCRAAQRQYDRERKQAAVARRQRAEQEAA